MPTYDYGCDPCEKRWTVVKPMTEYKSPETCPTCQASAAKLPSLFRVDTEAAGDWNRPHFSPALGQVVKGNREARQLAKSRGMEEVGTEPVENLHKTFEKKREETSDKRWKDADRDMLYD